MSYASFVDIIELWPNSEVLSRDLIEIAEGNPKGISGIDVRAWKSRDSIPPQYWRMIITAGADRGYTITLEDLQRCSVFTWVMNLEKKRRAA